MTTLGPRNTIIDVKSLPTTSIEDYSEIPVVPDKDNTNYKGLELDDQFFAISPDPANFIIFDIGTKKPENEIPEYPVDITEIIDESKPRFMETLTLNDAVGSPYPYVWQINESSTVGSQNPVDPNRAPKTPYRNVPMIAGGGLVGAKWEQDQPIPVALGGRFPECYFISTKPEEWLHIYNEEKYFSTQSNNFWAWTNKWVVPDEVFPSSGGPRNNGYTNIGNGVRAKINVDVTNSSPYDTQRTVTNAYWKTGSIELTLKPIKENCTILSGGANLQPQIAKRALPTGKNVQYGINETTLKVQAYGDNVAGEILVSDEVGPLGESLLNPSLITARGPNAEILFTVPDSGQLFLSSVDQLTKLFKVNLVNGKVVVDYWVPYSTNAKHVILESKTNIVDGNWHHVVINRPNADVEKYNGVKYGGTGRLEIWIDGVLEAATDEIKTSESIPTPQLLFNDINSLAYQQSDFHRTFSATRYENNWQNEGRPKEKAWVENSLREQNYEGGISDFVFRQSYALSPSEVNLNKTYAMTSADGTKIKKVKKMTATAVMVHPQVSSNKPKVLKLYWNSLLKDKEKCLDGIELDSSTYDVYSYSVSHKNIIDSSLTFNLDLNNNPEDRFFHKNVRAAASSSVFIFLPGISPTSNSYPDFFSPYAEGMDTDNNIQLNAFVNSLNGGPYYLENILYGGVDLVPGDRILLTKQKIKEENGIWEYQGPTVPLRRPQDLDSATLKNSFVYVEEGTQGGKTFAQIENVTHIRKDKQTWIEVDNQSSLVTLGSYPIHTSKYLDEYGNQKLINVNTDIAEDFDIIAFMNYPTSKNEILEVFDTALLSEIDFRYAEFITNIKTAVSSGKSLFVSSPMLAIDLGIVSDYEEIDQLFNESGDGQSAAISPFESGEPAENYFHTHRNMKYHIVQTLAGLTNKPTYIMTDFVTYSPDRTNSEYHIKYSNRQTGLQEGDEFYIPGLLTLPETINTNLPGYINNQKGLSKLIAFHTNKILFGTPITKFSNTYYVGSTPTQNPYDDYITTIAAEYGDGKIFVNCVENAYAMSRYDYNKGIIQNVSVGENAETAQTAAWQYSTKRLNKQNLYDFSEDTNLIGQTTPTNGGGGPIVQSQSHCSNGSIRLETNKDDLRFQSDLYPDFTEEVFATTEIPVSSMTWLGLQWLAG